MLARKIFILKKSAEGNKIKSITWNGKLRVTSGAILWLLLKCKFYIIWSIGQIGRPCFSCFVKLKDVSTWIKQAHGINYGWTSGDPSSGTNSSASHKHKHATWNSRVFGIYGRILLAPPVAHTFFNTRESHENILFDFLLYFFLGPPFSWDSFLWNILYRRSLTRGLKLTLEYISSHKYHMHCHILALLDNFDTCLLIRLSSSTIIDFFFVQSCLGETCCDLDLGRLPT